jgi:hypothetical protein
LSFYIDLYVLLLQLCFVARCAFFAVFFPLFRRGSPLLPAPFLSWGAAPLRVGFFVQASKIVASKTDRAHPEQL